MNMTTNNRLPNLLAPEPRWHHETFRAMNTDVYVWLYSRNGDLAHYVPQHFARIERSLSRFNDHSNLNRLNRCPDTRCIVEQELFSALEFAFWAADWTEGLFDPTILPALKQAGYDRSFELLPEPASFQWDSGGMAKDRQVAQSIPCSNRDCSYRDVRLDRNRREIIRPPYVQIDLGGMGKGWAVDRSADLLVEAGPFLINAGGDLYAHGYPGDARGWQIELVHPRDPARTMARLYLANRALATSTIAKRRWRQGSDIMHHLIDPRKVNGRRQPARTDALSVTVIAGRTVLADVLAKVALILGVNEGLAYLERLPGVEGLIYTADDRIVCTAGFAALLAAEGSSESSRTSHDEASIQR
jgi:thiamine biosynthesis lipoprotein